MHSEGALDLVVELPGEQRSRLTCALRPLLALPHSILLAILSIGAFVVVLIGWFAALVRGSLPEGIAGFLVRFLDYTARVYGYSMLLTDRFPKFSLSEADYPIRIEVEPGTLTRVTVLFRLLLLVPALIWNQVLTTGGVLLLLISWPWCVLRGRQPPPLHIALSTILRYSLRMSAYLLLTTDVYPWGWRGDRTEESQDRSVPRVSFMLGTKPKSLLVIAAVAGCLWLVPLWSSNFRDSGRQAAIVELADAYERFGKLAERRLLKMERCENLQCMLRLAGRAAQAVRAFGSEIDAEEFPSAYRPQVHRMLAAADRFAGVLERVSRAKSLEALADLATRLERLGPRFDDRYNELARALIEGRVP